MKQFLFAFSLWTGILMLVAKGAFHLAGLNGEIVDLIKSYALDGVVLNTFVMTALQGYTGIDLKLPSATRVAAIALFMLAVPLLLMGGAQAQTAASTTTGVATISQPVSYIAKAPAYLDTTSCTINQCTSWKIGIDMIGNGTNADILGQGVNQSVFAAGGIFDTHGGIDYWNGKYYAGVEAGIGYQFQSGPLAIGKSNLVGYQEFRLGGSLTGLINGAGAQSSITVPTALSNSLMAPYLAFGALERNGYAQWLNGAGAAFLLATNWDINIEYLYGAAVGNAPAVNMVKLGVNRHFSLF